LTSPSETSAPAPGANLLHDAWLILFDPRRVYFNLPRVNRSGRFLLLLLVLLSAVGWAADATGVHALAIRSQASLEAAKIYKQAEGAENQAVILEGADLVEKTAEFSVLFSRIGFMVGAPLRVLLTVACLTGVLFAAVALGGGKPKTAVLAGIPIFASIAELPRQLLYALLLSRVGDTHVETSLAACLQTLGGERGADLWTYSCMRRLDPFDLWFWALFALGMRAAARFSMKWTIVLIVVLALGGASERLLWDYLQFAEFQMNFGPPE
jgi:hypothetical protein